ncbi:hypothetical protein DPMN_129076 [Dreissena polymorpha]|uniref:Uncharacterized protein n=1 Tax=Dreissena polymorpha TaxID=45954 RepID=A0A9D4H8D1_DREPO|nr:hypothetical protein DPMN_129076 [Dreissena polymorpha]
MSWLQCKLIVNTWILVPDPFLSASSPSAEKHRHLHHQLCDRHQHGRCNHYLVVMI